MTINLPINELLKKGLTADDYTIACLIKEKKFGLLKTYILNLGNKFYDSLKRLKELEYIEYNAIGDTIPIKEASITEKFTDITSKGDIFSEFYEEYPIKTVRTDGTTDYLRRNKAKCKTRYRRITGNNLLIHDHIMDCLRFEINHRKEKNNMAYMKRMENWLINEEWKIISEEMLQIKEGNQSILKQKNKYGTQIL